MRRFVHVYGLIQTFSMHHKYTDTNITFIRRTPTLPSPTPETPLRGASWRRRAADRSLCWRVCRAAGALGRPASTEGKHFPASQRPPGGCPAAPAPRTRMFGLENDFPTPLAPFSNCPKGNYLVSFPLKKTQELWWFFFPDRQKLHFFLKATRNNICKVIITVITIN